MDQFIQKNSEYFLFLSGFNLLDYNRKTLFANEITELVQKNVGARSFKESIEGPEDNDEFAEMILQNQGKLKGMRKSMMPEELRAKNLKHHTYTDEDELAELEARAEERLEEAAQQSTLFMSSRKSHGLFSETKGGELCPW